MANIILPYGSKDEQYAQWLRTVQGANVSGPDALDYGKFPKAAIKQYSPTRTGGRQEMTPRFADDVYSSADQNYGSESYQTPLGRGWQTFKNSLPFQGGDFGSHTGYFKLGPSDENTAKWLGQGEFRDHVERGLAYEAGQIIEKADPATGRMVRHVRFDNGVEMPEEEARTYMERSRRLNSLSPEEFDAFSKRGLTLPDSVRRASALSGSNMKPPSGMTSKINPNGSINLNGGLGLPSATPPVSGSGSQPYSMLPSLNFDTSKMKIEAPNYNTQGPSIGIPRDMDSMMRDVRIQGLGSGAMAFGQGINAPQPTQGAQPAQGGYSKQPLWRTSNIPDMIRAGKPVRAADSDEYLASAMSDPYSPTSQAIARLNANKKQEPAIWNRPQKT